MQTHCEHALPSARAQLVFALHDRPIHYRRAGASEWTTWSRNVVHGPQQQHYIVGPKPPGAALGVAFRPGCAGLVLGMPTSELVDTHIGLSEMWGGCAEELRQHLLATLRPQSLFRVLEKSLTDRLRVPLLMHSAVALALSSAQPQKISDLSARADLSARHFIAKFREAVGVTPKQYFRIQRFNRATRCLASTRQPGLADLAISIGYSDQAHLTRDFREFAGVSPSRYAGLSQSPLHHRILHDTGAAPSGKKSSRPATDDPGQWGP